MRANDEIFDLSAGSKLSTRKSINFVSDGIK